MVKKLIDFKRHVWDKKQAESAKIPNFGKKYIGQKELFRMVGKNKLFGKKVLELGSGNGYWLELLQKSGAICTGVEISREQLNLAKKRDSEINYINCDIRKLDKSGLKDGQFDIVLIEHVLLEIPTLRQIAKILKSSFNLLKKSGIIIISDLHPFAASLDRKNIKVSKGYSYFSSGSIIRVISTRVDEKKTIYKDYHWTLSDFVKSITNAGFLISEMTEPRPTKKLINKYHELGNRIIIPKAFWIKAVKI